MRLEAIGKGRGVTAHWCSFVAALRRADDSGHHLLTRFLSTFCDMKAVLFVLNQALTILYDECIIARA